jgi:hypothetical protein
MPAVADLDVCIKRWGQLWAAKHSFPDYFDILWRSIEAFFRTSSSSLRPPIDFEKVLGEMIALAHWMEPAPWGDTLRQIACDGGPPPNLNFPPPYGEGPYGPTVMLKDQLQFLIAELAGHVRGLCRNIDSRGDAADEYGALFRGLRSAFDVGIYNLNYDTAALAAWPDAFTGFNEAGAFDPNGIHQRSRWDFIYHLHGSVHHSLVGEFGDAICWRQDLEGKFFDDHHGQSSDKRSEGREFPKTTLVAGGFKLDQLLVEPFQSMHAALVRHVYAADAILIGGYGFRDVHVNRALRNRLAIAGGPPVMVLDRAGDNTDPMEGRQDTWALELCATLGANGYFFKEHGTSLPRMPSELADNESFEVDAPHHVAIWYGGFTAAAHRLASIVSWLSGEADDVLTSPSLG